MIEVTGGRFWKPYAATPGASRREESATPRPRSGTPAGMNPDLYEYRPPIDLASPRLRRLAAALGPAYVRVSGTWANTTYFPDSDDAPEAPPPGFSGVLTRRRWKGVVDFARAVDAEIVTSMAASPGTRDAAGVWTPAQARRFLAYTKAVGSRIAAAEFMNEPNFAAMGGAPADYDAAAYGRDFKVFRRFAKEAVDRDHVDRHDAGSARRRGTVRVPAVSVGIASAAAPHAEADCDHGTDHRLGSAEGAEVARRLGLNNGEQPTPFTFALRRVADGPIGPVKVRFTERNAIGVLDHDVVLPSGATIHNPIRMVPNGAGSEVTFTLLRQPRSGRRRSRRTPRRSSEAGPDPSRRVSERARDER